MKQISINKTLDFENNKVKIKYEGISRNDDIDLDRIEKLFDDFMKNHRHDNMIENVCIVRTIMQDCDEELLVILCQNGKNTEFVKYENSCLSLYEKRLKENNSKCFDKYRIKYEVNNGMTLDYNNYETDVTDYYGVENVSIEITEIMKQIYCLKNTKKVVLSRNDKALIEIYKLFYNENPDFSSKDINIKFQAMMSILDRFGISLGDEYDFSISKEINMPVSLTLEKIVNKLYPLGEVKDVKDNVKLADQAKEVINIVGKSIREAIADENDKNRNLITISTIVHANKYCLSFDSDAKKLSEFAGCTTDEIESNMKLIRRIENKIDND